MKKTIIIGILALFLLIGSVSAGCYENETCVENLSTDVGSNYINWSWVFNESSEAALWIDGVFIMNTTRESYILSDLNERESHNIALTNKTNYSEIYLSNTTKTFYPFMLFYIILSFLLFITILSMLLQIAMAKIMMGAIGFIIGMLSFYICFPMYLSIIGYLCLTLSIINMLMILGTCFVMIGDSLHGFDNDEE